MNLKGGEIRGCGSRGQAQTKEKAEDSAVTKDESEDQDSPQSMVQCTVYVEGIPFNATPEQVKQSFVTAGIEDVVDIRLPTWQDSGRLRGYGHIHFQSAESYEKH